MGTGVGEAALAAEAIGAAEAAGAVAGAGGMAEAGLLGGEFAGGLGLTGGLTEGLGSMAGLGGEYGGLSSLSPAFQTATAGTATYNPEVASQVLNAVNPAAVPTAGTPLGTGQTGALATRSIASGATPYFADVGGTPGLSSGLPFTTGGAQVAASAVSPEAAAWDAATSGQYYGPEAVQTLAGNADKAALLSDAGYGPAASPAELGTAAKSGGFDGLRALTQPIQDWWKDQNDLTKYGLGGLGAMQAAKYLNKPQGVAAPEKYSGPLSKFSYNPSTYTPYTYKPYAAGGPVEEMSRENALGANTGYPQADIRQGAYATPWQTPVSRNVVTGPSDANVDQMTGEERMAGGGIANLGGYSDGGRLLKGPGDGMSDNIPANIGGRQPARLADGEFVVPADVVSGLGNGSTDAGAKQLYKMLDKVRSARTGSKKQGKQINPNKYTPA